MKAVMVAVCILLPTADAWAISRYDPTRMSCGQVRAAIADEGAVLLRYRSPRNRSLTLYDRYVASSRFCDMGEVRERRIVPSADLDSCTVYRCKRLDFDDPHQRFIFRGD